MSEGFMQDTGLELDHPGLVRWRGDDETVAAKEKGTYKHSQVG